MRSIFLTGCLIILSASFMPQGHASGIQIGRTRIIYDANKREVALSLANTEKSSPWLVQSWTDTGDGKTRGPFIVTPPLFRLDAQKEQSLRISWTGAAVAEDRESLFYLNVRTIPATPKDDEEKNILKLIFKTRLKLFFRPKNLDGTPAEACKNLQFQRHGSAISITNNASFYVVFDSLLLGSTPVPKADMVAPKSTVQIEIPSTAAARNVNWHCITDYGNASEKFEARSQ